MLSLYTSAVLTTVMIAGVTAYAISESQKTPAFAVESTAIIRAHEYAWHKGKASPLPPAVPGSTSIREVDLGPFFRDGKSRSFFRSTYDANLPASYPYHIAEVTWYEPKNSAEANRIMSRMSLDDKTRVGIYGEDSQGVGGEPIPDIGVSIPTGAVVVVSEQ